MHLTARKKSMHVDLTVFTNIDNKECVILHSGTQSHAGNVCVTLCFITNLDLLIIMHILNGYKHDYSKICMRDKWEVIIIISNTFVNFYSVAPQCS